MLTVGAYEAKTKLPELLNRVEAGERIVITRHGKPVAELVSPVVSKGWSPELLKLLKGPRQAFPSLKEIRAGQGTDLPRREL